MANGRLTNLINGTGLTNLVSSPNSTLPGPITQAVTAASESVNLQNPSTFKSLLG